MSQQRNKRRRSLRRRSAKRDFARHYDQGGYQRSLFHELLEDRRMLTAVHPFDLATLDGDNGFRLGGIDAGDYSGWSVSTAGDINGDGYSDILVGAKYADPGGDNGAGETYVIFGSGGGFAASLDLATLNGSNGFRLDGIDVGDHSGYSVSTAGDVNGDGYADILVGAYAADPGGDSEAGETYVVFGSGGGFAASLDLSTLDGSNGFRLDGIDASDRSGHSVSSAGDVNGDGYADILVGAYAADPGGDSEAGETYVVFGSGGGFAASLDLSTLDGSNGFRLDGIDANDRSGRSVSSAGDVNGDGYADILVGAYAAGPGGDSEAGETYVVFGSGSAFTASLVLSTLNGTNGFRLDGIDVGDRSGISVSTAGDVNGDGYADILVGAYLADPGGNSKAGETYVVFGRGGGFAASLDLSTLDGSNGFRLDGIDAGDYSGWPVSTAGDVNGDGYADILVGASAADPGGDGAAGETYVVFGSGSGFAASLDLSTLDGSNGFRLDGIDVNDRFGRSVSSAGDVNGDGYADILVGAYGDDQFTGETYVVFGGDFTENVTHKGTSAADTLTGDGTANVMVAGQGDDILDGKGGADVLYGAEGDDVLRISDTVFARIDGGRGTDTLALNGSGLTLDLTAIADNKLRGIEQIDITGSGNNTLILNQLEVLNLSDTSNTLVVMSDSADTSEIGDGWIADSSETINGVIYTVYRQGAAALKLRASFDFGDAPSPYPVTLAEDGARHVAIGPTLGVTRDSEPDGIHSAAADADDATGSPDDEDGVTFGTIQVGQLDNTVTVNVQNAPEGAKLDAWIDFNRDGNWGGIGERIFASIAVVNGENELQFDVPSWALSGTTYSRFRISTGGELGVQGLAENGEVEDWQLEIASIPNGSLHFGSKTLISNKNRPTDVVASDLDGDGDVDLLSASPDDDLIVWYENDGDQNFTEHLIGTADRVRNIQVQDLDGDGDLDLVSSSYGDGITAWYENDGDQNFTKYSIGYQNGTHFVQTCDLDGDGDMDVLTAAWGADSIVWFENDGTQNFTMHLIDNTADGAHTVDAGDMDGDGDLDVFSTSFYGDRIAWYENDGNENFNLHTIDAEADGATQVMMYDMDGDGDMDVFSTHADGNAIVWYENDGSENFTYHLISTDGVGAGWAEPSDLDGDGDIDVIGSWSATGKISVYQNDGNGNFVEFVLSSTFDSPGRFEISDVDQDGDFDIIATEFYGEAIVFIESFLPPSPTLDHINDRQLSEDAEEQQVQLTGITDGDDGTQPLRVTAVSSDTDLISDPMVTYTSAETTGSIAFTPVADQSGTATITVTVEDGGLDNDLDTSEGNATFSRSFDVIVNSINDDPTLDNFPLNEIVQTGDIRYENTSSNFGWSVALSSDGQTVAAGAPHADPNGSSSGHVRIFRKTGEAWIQLGSDIDGELAQEQAGFSVSINGNGSVVAIGSPVNDGKVRAYQYNVNSTQWEQIGATFQDTPAGNLGRVVSLSEDGTILAIGDGSNDGGRARVFRYEGNSWNQMGSDLLREAPSDGAGEFISLSPDGMTIAVGAYLNDGNGNRSGHARIYRYENTDWTQLGSDIDGEAANDKSGRVSLSTNGNVIAIGATENSGNGTESGHVRIFRYDSNGNQWVQLGDDLDGEASQNWFGSSVSISGDGSILAMGAPGNDGNGPTSGHVRLFRYDALLDQWIQIGDDIDGEAAGVNSGWAVSLSADGTSLAIGAHGSGNGSQGNHVTTYQITNNRTNNEDASEQTINLSGISAGGSESQPLRVTAVSSDTDLIAAPTVEYISNDGLIAYYPFDGNADDTSGNGNDGIVHGAVLSPDRFGNAESAYAFDDTHIEFDIPLLPQGSAARTLSLWTTTEVADNSADVIAQWGRPDIDEAFALFTMDNEFHGSTYGTLAGDLSSGVSTDGGWHHLALTLAGDQMKIYVDGDLKQTKTASADTQGTTLVAGKQVETLTHSYTGRLDDLRIYDRPLSANEITELYNLTSDTGTVSFTPLADASGTATITVTVEDAGLDGDFNETADNGTFSRTFDVAVNPINDDPTLDTISNLTIVDDAPEQTVNLTGITAGPNENQPLKLTATSSNTSVISDPTVDYTTADATGSLTFTPLVNQYGTATITVTVEDAGPDGDLNETADNATFSRTFDVNVQSGDDDFGDAPSPYPVTTAEAGPWHVSTGPTLGTERDSEDDGTHSADATADDTTGTPDDEDGVTFGTIMVGQLDATVTVNVQNAPEGAKLDAWIDFNRDGNWGGPGEQIADTVAVANGDNTVEFDVPSWAQSGQTHARFRLSNAGNLGMGGVAADGEVEDYQLTITPAAATAGIFGAQNIITTSADWALNVYASDVDSDGDMDLLSASHEDGKIAWYENDGDENFTSHTITTSTVGAYSVFTTDLDGDGDMDILSASSGDNKIAWYENDGSENFTPRAITTDADGARSVYVADVDADGDIDILSASSDDNTIAWYENDGDENFTPHIVTTVANHAFSVHASDMDGDGDIDILSASGDDDKVAWYENDGNGNFTPHTVTTSADRTISVYASDVDGDGDMDILSASIDDDKIAWYENNGSGEFTPHTITTNADGAITVFAADADGDGDMDVFSASEFDNKIAWYENTDGTGDTFTTHTITTSANGARSVYLADVDSDGDMDVLSASYADNKIAWYENNATPTLDSLADLTIDEDAPEQTVSLTGITAGGSESQPLRVTAVSNDTDLIPDPVVTYPADDWLTAGLVASYSFTGNALDETGHGHDGTVTGASLTTDRYGTLDGAYSFDGTDDWIDLGNVVSRYDVITMSAWVKTIDVFSGHVKGIISKPGTNGGGGARLGLQEPNKLDAGFLRLSPLHNEVVTATNTINDGKWHLATYVNDGTTFQLYVDGQLDGERSYTPGAVTSNSAMVIGKELLIDAGDGSGQRFFQGEVDDVRIYDRPLSANEITELYNLTSDTGTVSFTPLDNQYGTATITITVEDGGLDNDLDTASDNATFSRTVTVTVNSINDDPVATDILYQPPENLRFEKDKANGLATLVTDIDEDNLTFSVVAGPSDGQLVLNEDGSFHYTPDTNFNLTDSFTYVANDGTVDSNIGTVTLKIDTEHTWYNCREPRDVNADNLVTPLDVLWIINSLNSDGSRALSKIRNEGVVNPFLDVNRDAHATPLDALWVINYLNQQPAGEGEGASETPAAALAIDRLMSEQAMRRERLERASRAVATVTGSVSQPVLDNTPYWQRVDETLDSIMRPARRSQLSDADSDRDELFEQSDWLDFLGEDEAF